MTVQSFSSPSPGELLKHMPKRQATMDRGDRTTPDGADVEIVRNPFRPHLLAEAFEERGVMLAPLLVTWQFRVANRKPFVKWLQTKILLLSKARLEINQNTAGIRYFGTYFEPETSPKACPETSPQISRGISANDNPTNSPINCQTHWGFSSEQSMEHMFELCRGNIERLSIVETDLLDFVMGLRAFIQEAGQEHFEQKVHVALTGT